MLKSPLIPQRRLQQQNQLQFCNMLRLATLLLLAAPSSGWAVGLGNDTADIDEPGANGTGMLWRWSRDTNGTTESRASVLGSQRGTGLSGGTTWSLDPRFC